MTTALLASDFTPDETAQWLSLLRAGLPGVQIVAARGEVADETIEFAFVANPPPGALAGLPRLRFVQSLWAGVEKLLADATLPTNVPLARMVDPAMTAAMCETALWAVLGLQHDTFDYARQQAASMWQQHPPRRADELPVTVLGLGELGRAVVQRLAANGYPVTGWSTREGRWPAVLHEAQVVVNLLPLTAATRGLLDAQAFAAMRPGAALVNLARGAHVVEADLLAALDAGHLRHAVLDVFAIEPLPAQHRFWSHPRITVLPHVAAQTDPRSAAAIAAEQLRRVQRGEPPLHLVDRQRGY